MPSKTISSSHYANSNTLLIASEALPHGIGLLMPFLMRNRISPKNFLAAVTQAPIASAIIVMEMIDGHEMVISLMAVTLIAKAFSSRLSPELYQRLAVGFRNANDPDHLRSP